MFDHLPKREFKVTLNITVRADGATIEDLESKNGTFLGDTRVEAACEIHDRDLVRFGSVCGTFRSAPPASTLTDPGARRELK